MLTQIEALQSHIKKLNDRCSSKGVVVVVEGKRDVAALKPILKADFFILNNGINRSLYETAEVLASSYRSVILMFDADTKGKELGRKMKSYLQMHGLPVREDDRLLKLSRARAVEDIRTPASL